MMIVVSLVLDAKIGRQDHQESASKFSNQSLAGFCDFLK